MIRLIIDRVENLDCAIRPSVGGQCAELHRVLEFAGDHIITLGRQSDNDVVLPERTVDRLHATIEPHKTGILYTITDMKSHFGIIRNKKPVDGRAPLVDGDALFIKPFEIKVEIDS